MSDKLVLDESKLTLGDLEDFEEAAGKPFDEAMKSKIVLDDDGKPVRDKKGRPERALTLSAKSMIALVWILKRHDIEGFTLDDARKVRVSELEITGSGDADPKDEKS